MLFFFFQAEDGIRDKLVTGVQTCALPISLVIRAGGRRRAAPRSAAAPPSPPPNYEREREPPRSPRRPPRTAAPPRRSAPELRDRESVVEGKRGDLRGRRII